MYKIKVDLRVAGKAILFQVLAQDESLRRWHQNIPENLYEKSFTTADFDYPISIISRYHPAVDKSRIFIRGIAGHKDLDVYESSSFNSVMEALECKRRIIDALTQFAQGGYFDGKDPNPNPDIERLEF